MKWNGLVRGNVCLYSVHPSKVQHLSWKLKIFYVSKPENDQQQHWIGTLLFKIFLVSCCKRKKCVVSVFLIHAYSLLENVSGCVKGINITKLPKPFNYTVEKLFWWTNKLLLFWGPKLLRSVNVGTSPNFSSESSAKEVRDKDWYMGFWKMSRGDLISFDQHMAHKLTNFIPLTGAVPHNHPWGLQQHGRCWIFWISSEGCKHAKKVVGGQYCWAVLRSSPNPRCCEVKGSQGFLDLTVPRSSLPSQPSKVPSRFIFVALNWGKYSHAVRQVGQYWWSQMMYMWTILKLQSQPLKI